MHPDIVNTQALAVANGALGQLRTGADHNGFHTARNIGIEATVEPEEPEEAAELAVNGDEEGGENPEPTAEEAALME